MDWKHDDLAHDLAQTLRAGDRVVWEDMQLGPSGSPRPDVYTVPKSYANFRPIAYEVKISVSDFRRDVTAGKWQSYLRYASGVVFAVPAGLIDKREIPSGCGLMIRGETGWRTVKGPTLSRVENLPLEAWLKLFIDGFGRSGKPITARSADGWIHTTKARRILGEKIARLLADVAGAESWLNYELERLRDRREKAVEEQKKLEDEIRKRASLAAMEVDAARRELAMALGLDGDASTWEIQRAARAAANRLSTDGEVERLTRILVRVRSELAAAEKDLPPIACGDCGAGAEPVPSAAQGG
jgi:hypothetical protein